MWLPCGGFECRELTGGLRRCRSELPSSMTGSPACGEGNGVSRSSVNSFRRPIFILLYTFPNRYLQSSNRCLLKLPSFNICHFQKRLIGNTSLYFLWLSSVSI